jgi:hypothetical protein
MERPFEKGMSVICLNSESLSDSRRGLLQVGKIYKISGISWNTEIKLEGISEFYWRTDRFRLVAFSYKKVESKLP